MDHLPRLHVLAGHRSGLCSVLNDALAPFTHTRLWGVVPPARDVHAGDFVVVDLRDPPSSAEPSSLDVFVRNGGTVWLVLGETLVAPRWVEFARLPGVRVVRCGVPEEWLGYGAVVTELLERVRGPTGERIATLVVQAEPALRPVKELVQAVCLEPWSIRRPRDLAQRCAMSLGELRRCCTQIGFARVEHFVICVRLVAYEQLVATARLPVGTARLLAGFDDPSNMRRHSKRAARRSLPVAHALESCHVASRRTILATRGQAMP